MLSKKLRLGYGGLSGNVYLGRQEGNRWIGSKRDVTDEFIGVMLQKFGPNTSQVINVDDKPTYRVLVVDINRTITVDGKEVADED